MTIAPPTQNPGTTTSTAVNEYSNISLLGKDPLSAVIAGLFNDYGKQYYGHNIVGKGSGKFTIEERYQQVLAMMTKYTAFRQTFGGLMYAIEGRTAPKSGDYSITTVSSLFRTSMENSLRSGSGTQGTKPAGNWTQYLWDIAPATVTDQFGPNAVNQTAGWATSVLKAMGVKNPGANAIANLQRLIGAESAGNLGASGQAGDWLRDNNPLNYDTWAGQHAPSAIAAKYGGKIVHEFGIDVMVFPTEADGIKATAEFLATQTQQAANGYSMFSALQQNADAAAFGGALSTSGWSSAGYANSASFAALAPYGEASPSGTPTPQSLAASIAAVSRAIITAEGVAYNAQATQTKDYSSYETIQNELYNWGIDDPALAHWAWSRAQKGEDATQILLDLRQTPQYAQRFPGLVERYKQGLPYMSEAQYIDYERQMMSYANTVALPKGFITPKEIGTLIANSVSPAEFNARIQALQSVALKADPAVRAEFAKYFGVRGGLGALTAYFADPHRATGLLTEQVNTAQIGAEAINSGFGALSKANALQLAQDEASGKIALGSSRSDLDKAASESYLTTRAPGATAPLVSRADLLAAQVPGYDRIAQSTAQQSIRNAESAREAPMEAGGGFAATARGVRGAGGASTEGTSQT